MTAVFIITICVLALWFIGSQLHLTVDLSINFLKKDGYLALHFFGISIIKLKIKYIEFDVKARRVYLKLGKKIVAFSFTLPAKGNDSVFNYIAFPIFNLVDFIYFYIDFSFGDKSDAFVTMMITQTVRMTASAFTSFVKSTQRLETEEKYRPIYGSDELKFSFRGIISASVADIIYSFISAFRQKIKKANLAKARNNKEKIYVNE